MKKLRIAVWHNLPSGGGKRQLYNHVKGLVERGHYVEAWCPETADQKYLPLGKMIKEHIVPLKNKNYFHDIIKPLGAAKNLVKAMHEHCAVCASEINKGDFDVLFANSCMFLRTTPIGAYVNLPSTIYLNEPYRWFYEAMPELPWVAPQDLADLSFFSLNALRNYIIKQSRLNGIRYQAREELECAKEFDLILANSRYSRESILRAYNLEAKVCYLGIDTEYYRPTGEAKERFVVGLGTIYHGKGIDRAINAIGTIQKAKRPDLIWIGNGAAAHDLKEYTALAKDLGVNFLPKIHIPDKEVISLLSRALVMLYTSRLEPFGLAPLEANACGTPVVGIAEGGIRETTKNEINGFLCDDDDPEILGQLLTKFIDDPELSNRMGGQARKYVEDQWKMTMCTDNIESWLIRLSGMGNKRLEKANLDDRILPKEFTRNPEIKVGIDRFAISNNRLRIEGWAFIDDGKSTENSEIYLIVKDGTLLRSFHAEKITRHDLAGHFGNQINYAEAGFRVNGRIARSRGHEFGILIKRNEKISFTKIKGK